MNGPPPPPGEEGGASPGRLRHTQRMEAVVLNTVSGP